MRTANPAPDRDRRDRNEAAGRIADCHALVHGRGQMLLLAGNRLCRGVMMMGRNRPGRHLVGCNGRARLCECHDRPVRQAHDAEYHRQDHAEQSIGGAERLHGGNLATADPSRQPHGRNLMFGSKRGSDAASPAAPLICLKAGSTWNGNNIVPRFPRRASICRRWTGIWPHPSHHRQHRLRPSGSAPIGACWSPSRAPRIDL